MDTPSGTGTSTRPALDVPRVDVLGVMVSAVNMPMALETIEGWIARREPHYVTITGVHGVMESQSDPEILKIHNAAGLVTPDGMPLVWISHRKGWQHVRRVYGPDLMLALCERSQSLSYRHFLYGATPFVLDQLAQRLVARYPGLQIVGRHSPPFRALSPAEDEAIVQAINEARPDIVWVGLSTPKQERWMAAHRERLTAPVLIGVGAAFDFHAGVKRQAPLWMQRSGLEWLFRMCSEPRRLGRRYLSNNSRFLLALLRQMVRGEAVGRGAIGVKQ
jgi:N-acetylglucosaminyldiphosphoundecaprenol N-acetyl-beta-D-mannosaminyltransferase